MDNETLSCRSCGEKNLTRALDLGEQYLSDFRTDESKPEKHPLSLVRCEVCALVQLTHSVKRDLMYHDGYGYRSGTNEIIRENLAWIVSLAKEVETRGNKWLDIACNDGTLLSHVGDEFYRVGVDPVKKFKQDSMLHADHIIDDYFAFNLLGETFDFISSISMFYDLDNPNDFVADVKQALSPGGVWFIQQNYLGSMFDNVSFDNICHEHLTYFSLSPLEQLLDRNGLMITQVWKSDINGGSILTAVRHREDGIEIHPSVSELATEEKMRGTNTQKALNEFGEKSKQAIGDIEQFLDAARKSNKTVMIYGASTRGATIWQSVGESIDWVKFAVERQEEKVGRIYSSLGIPIISEATMRMAKPDFLLIGPWFLRQSFVSREEDYLATGGKLVFPLPQLEIVG